MKKLWDTKAFSTGDSDTRKSKALMILSGRFLTILLSIFLLFVVAILGIVLWTSNGGDQQKEAEKAFYNPSQSSSQVAASSTATSSQTMISSDEQEEEVLETTPAVTPNGGTVVVSAGEGAGQIAARAGISVDQLYALNPDKMVGPGGTWWANPGDVVYVD